MTSGKPQDPGVAAAENTGGVRDLFGKDADRYDARHYGSRYRTFIGDRQTLVNRILQSVGLQPGARVLDVACGPGHFLTTAVSIGATAVGIDASRDMLRTSANRLGARARLVQGDALALPFGSGSFDLLNCSGLIEYFPDPAPILREFARVVKPGGRAMVSSTNRRSPALTLSPIIDAVRRSRTLRKVIRTLRPSVDEVSLNQRRFAMTFHTPRELEQLVAAAGFEAVELHYCHLQLFPHPFDHLVPVATTACVSVTDRFLGVRALRAFAEGLLAFGRKPSI